MKNRIKLVLAACCFATTTLSHAQGDIMVENEKTPYDTYIAPKDKEVKENLSKWQDYKFGVLIHMGLYSQLGICESWGLAPEDWVTRNGYDDYDSFASDYRGARFSLNPTNLDSEKWAKMFKNAGAKYLIFTSKHHDGFCMYDSKFTDFKITNPNLPSSKNKNPDVLKNVLDASRKEGLSVGIYFSKPDWTSQDFWWKYYPPKDRNPNYDIKAYPEKWQSFVKYTQNQLDELTSNYGKVDILWLDGGWVRPVSTVKENEGKKGRQNLDINMKLIAETARKKQPGLIVVDRWVPGEYEDYLTPERKVLEKPIPVPWESCVTLGNDWGWVPNDKYKSGTEVIQLLTGIVAKGGNLLLGVGPDGKGDFEPKIQQTLAEVGKWLDINGEAIYATRPIAPYSEGNLYYTSKGEKTVFGIYLPTATEKEIPSQIVIKNNLKGKLNVTLLANKQKLSYKSVNGGISVTIPNSLKAELAKQGGVSIKVSAQ
ncbi:alpha-L-fucosidase [Flavobacterium granuli]|uniref:alpha-L-fucosidase n=1 Tax=Flavobacterium granuli TaxID=280093 RepID=A0ABU1S0Y9_9FLAO|nr:alpha-L-fucosidase [Flavobacterium granuli]MDR6844694.1 alpha-L-fucosidase [Flavobacterium granuli]